MIEDYSDEKIGEIAFILATSTVSQGQGIGWSMPTFKNLGKDLTEALRQTREARHDDNNTLVVLYISHLPPSHEARIGSNHFSGGGEKTLYKFQKVERRFDPPPNPPHPCSP